MSDDKSISVATLMRQMLARRWMSFLTPAEFAVCYFIYERTYPFGKTEEIIAVDHFLNGITSRNFHQGRLPHDIGRTRLMSALKSLESKGAIIRRRRSGRCTVYGLNPEWNEGQNNGESYSQSAVGNEFVPNGSHPHERSAGVPSPEHRTTDQNTRIELLIEGKRAACGQVASAYQVAVSPPLAKGD